MFLASVFCLCSFLLLIVVDCYCLLDSMFYLVGNQSGAANMQLATSIHLIPRRNADLNDGIPKEIL